VASVRNRNRADANSLTRDGFAWAAGPFRTAAEAFRHADDLLPERDETIAAPVEVIGQFVIPPRDGAPSRDFQTLHVDFGLPLDPTGPSDVARYTALHIPMSVRAVNAVTRLVPLRDLAAGHRWPTRAEMVRRLVAYGVTRGTRADGTGYIEGSFARIVEAVLGQTPVLPSLRANPGFLCGEEFPALADELGFFSARGIPLEAATIEVALQPGQLLVFDNLTVTHGRRGRRNPGELEQRVFGYRALPVPEQVTLRDRWLDALTSRCDDRS
jgi:hypothetical protein